MGRKNANISASPTQTTTAVTTTTTATILHSATNNATGGATKRAVEVQEDGSDAECRPSKKRKVGLLGPGLEKYDATGLVPFYTEPSQVPVHLKKYFSQRERYFSRYSSGCLLDEEGWYSITPERIADQIAERCRCDIVLDAFCGVGGNAIAFARTCERVIALDISPVRLALARHNAALYGVADRIEFILADFLSFARTLPQQQSSRHRLEKTRAVDAAAHYESLLHRKIDVIFLSPPWGGPSYLSDSASTLQGAATENGDINALEPPEYSLASIRPVHGAQLFKLARRITKNVAYFLPRNVRLDEVAALLKQRAQDDGTELRNDGHTSGGGAEKIHQGGENTSEIEMVEVEEEWMGSKLKALTCYFGGLAAGQEHLF
ncbi:Trimethylguanosine synthase [Sparassis crispa]|uniref:Trimethylguanosine synthase n=1 Tax=Sparassis crispa TaxID=139825 RepID=A0A401GWI4_9APHY|nr:Trimethylguanosine synthase [Sparassis crispa]GBE86543.1 Trimethylguanosine synthase [Sparassis crispa]